MADTTGWSRERILEARAIWAKAWAEGATAMRGIVTRVKLDADAKLTAREEFPLPRVLRTVQCGYTGRVDQVGKACEAAGGIVEVRPVDGNATTQMQFSRYDLDKLRGLLDNPYEEDE